MTTDFNSAERETLERQLDQLCDRLDVRLQALEPFRALGQLKAREAEGQPVEAIATAELKSHLERELNADVFYRVWVKLVEARLALRLPVAQPAAEPAVTPVPPVEPVPEAPVVASGPEPLMAWDTDNLHRSASAAVASAFGVAVIVQSAKAESPLVSEARAAMAERVWLPLAAPRSVLFGRPVTAAQPAATVKDIAEVPLVAPVSPNVVVSLAASLAKDVLPAAADISAEATVLASLAKLRGPPPPPAIRDIEANRPRETLPPRPVLESATLPDLYAKPKAASVSMEGTMANVAAAVAATVAAAERISGPQAIRGPRQIVSATVPPPGSPSSRIVGNDRPAEIAGPPAKPQRPAPAASGKLFRDQAAGPPPVEDEGLEIRFVSRPASPMLDALARSAPSPLADVPMPPAARTLAPSGQRGAAAASDWEEASVEIRHAPTQPTPVDPHTASDPSPLADRATAVLGRFVKVLKRDRTEP